MEVNYITLLLLVNINVFIGSGIVYSFKSWSRFKNSHLQEAAEVLHDLRATEIPLMIAGLIDYIDQERRRDKRIRIDDILSHGYPDQQLSHIEPHLRKRELIGASEIKLKRLSSSASRLATISISSLTVAAISIFPPLIILAVQIDTVGVYWYAAPGAVFILTLVTGLISLAAMHISETRFDASIAELKTKGVNSDTAN